MGRFVFTSKKTAAGPGKKSAALFEILPAASLKKHSPSPDDFSYLDITGIGPAELKKTLALLKKRCSSSRWGIIDPKGQCSDPAFLFFEGASDYIGPRALAGLSKKRLTAAASWRDALSGSEPDAADTAGAAKSRAREEKRKKSVRFPSGKFAGWKSMRTGTVAPFFFLYVALSSGNDNIRTRLGEKAFTTVRNRLRDYLQQRFQEASALLWMESESTFLFLVPPRANYGKAALAAGLKIILAAPLIGIENLGLSIPVNFTLALHYGKTPFQAPGKTGTVVSDAVNFVFHLGSKYAEPDRLSISSEIPDEVIPPGLRGLFAAAGEYEGFAVRHSRRFTYSR
jgi:hypothetical protein